MKNDGKISKLLDVVSNGVDYMKTLWDLFLAFLRTGTFGFGGGQAAIPLIQAEAVDKYKWITEEEFGDFLAMGNTLPGPIATKMSIIIGFNEAGFLGAVVSLVGMILPSALLIIFLYSFFMANKEHPFVKGMQVAAKPVVVVLIAGVAFSMARGSVFANVDFSTSKTIIVFGIFIIAGVLVLMNELVPTFNVHPAFIIIAALLVGGFFIR